MLRDLLLDGVRRAAQRALQRPHMRPLAPAMRRDAEEPGTAAAIIAAWSGQDLLQLGRGVEHGGSYGDGFIHLLVPAAHFWDDIVYT